MIYMKNLNNTPTSFSNEFQTTMCKFKLTRLMVKYEKLCMGDARTSYLRKCFFFVQFLCLIPWMHGRGILCT